jgi:hypothetical protein
MGIFQYPLDATRAFARILDEVDVHSRLYVEPHNRMRYAASIIFKHWRVYTEAEASGQTPEQYAYKVWHIHKGLDDAH